MRRLCFIDTVALKVVSDKSVALLDSLGVTQMEVVARQIRRNSNSNEITKNNGKKIFRNRRDADSLGYVSRSEAESLLEQNSFSKSHENWLFVLPHNERIK